ncbi:hypothetical protein JVT61DRAFT_6814 [Boletus reticuloceps]|uniref:Uncharacterized protein n=1 Tax=Boletus reticuloceps TaxID=495285 RepID=A0A8I2YIZ7_9AGAM|nr:hypothetical protein JVT61DRAFT_6814 [Boletus reticuloceps]
MPSQRISGALSALRETTRYILFIFALLLVLDQDIQDYLYQLAESVRALAPASYDSHLFALEVGPSGCASALCTDSA